MLCYFINRVKTKLKYFLNEKTHSKGIIHMKDVILFLAFIIICVAAGDLVHHFLVIMPLSSNIWVARIGGMIGAGLTDLIVYQCYVKWLKSKLKTE